ncbi:MAG: hypothetical protein Q4D16_06975 [Eubacteriales bacterium]|nr:hypothetical protein [Eubacteriales bacterium]
MMEAGGSIGQDKMQRVYEEMKTPYKIGMVLSEEGCNIDCPNVFRTSDGQWKMVYAKHIPGQIREGYETWIARSENLIHWETEGKLLSKRTAGWDCCQADGGICLIDTQWGGDCRVRKYDNKYWMTYIGGALPGYEPDPLNIGLAFSETMEPGSWKRLDNPVLSTNDSDIRDFERETLYKSTVIYDEGKHLDAPFVMYYNAKQKGLWIERIGIAVSEDMIHWKRYGKGAVIENERSDISNIAGDPQIIRFGSLWVMHYFIAQGGTAYDTFACSEDLVNWTKWDGQPLIFPSEGYDRIYAHKPFVLKHEGIVYHFYCAVGDKGRGIALAVSHIS